MKKIIFIDEQWISDFYPICLTKPFSEVLMGMNSFRARWEDLSGCKVAGNITAQHLNEKYGVKNSDELFLFIDPRIVPNLEVIEQVKNLKPREALYLNGQFMVSYSSLEDFTNNNLVKIESNTDLIVINKLWDLFIENDSVLRQDFDFYSNQRKRGKVSKTNTLIRAKDIFIEEGAEVECSILNAKSGPIFISKSAKVLEGCLVRGSLFLGESSQLNMGSKIYGATSIGKKSKVGGEVNNSIFLGYSNKGHDGFLGHSIIGEWCNLGAGTNNSNLKNTYDQVKLYNYTTQNFQNTNQQFCGLIMGDHSKSAIGSIFNTGTVVGVSSNIFQNGFPRNFIPSFTWGDNQHGSYNFEKAKQTMCKVLERRGMSLKNEDLEILKYIYSSEQS